MEERLTEIEIQLAQQAETIRALHEVLVDQQRTLDALRAELVRLAGLVAGEDLGERPDPRDEPPPPHY